MNAAKLRKLVIEFLESGRIEELKKEMLNEQIPKHAIPIEPEQLKKFEDLKKILESHVLTTLEGRIVAFPKRNKEHASIKIYYRKL